MKIKFEINKLQLAPGDILAVRFPVDSTVQPDDVAEAMSNLKRLLPSGVGLAVFRGDVELSVIQAEVK